MATRFGHQGGDTIRGEQGADRLFGGIGNDVFQVTGISDISGLADTVDGGNQVDTLDFLTLGASGRVNLLNVENLVVGKNTVTLTAQQFGAFEAISGTEFYERPQIATAGLVDLTNAVIVGIDEMHGTAGADTSLFASATGNILVDLLAGADSVAGGDGNDIQTGGTAIDTLNGGAGQDEQTGQAGTDNMTGGLGATTFVFDDLWELDRGVARHVITDFVYGRMLSV